jgi:hypothetical protein
MQDPIEKMLKVIDAQIAVQQVVAKGLRQIVQNEVFAAGLKLAASAVIKTIGDLKEEYDAAKKNADIESSGLTPEEYAEREAEDKKRTEDLEERLRKSNESFEKTMNDLKDKTKTEQ